ncbi:NAD(P)-binding protein, partial [Leucobacter celer]|uniref:NAD(P)-binding protein n=1 Tax=Leucobacter celer TaxID=668625 RepID=UPI000AE1F961
ALLAREAHRVHLFARNARLGGRAGTLESEGFRFANGPSWYLMPRVFEPFFVLLGSATEEQPHLRTLDPA